jgi:F0F1-type ATP synthase delta subunit
MTRKFLKEMVQASLTKDKLDVEKVDEISKRLKRSDLKAYLRALKHYSSQNSITITTAYPIGKDQQRDLTQKLEGKNVNFNVDPDRLFGVEIIDGDMIYDNTLRRTFDEVVDFVGN